MKIRSPALDGVQRPDGARWSCSSYSPCSAAPGSAQAQFMFLDVDHDGQYSRADANIFHFLRYGNRRCVLVTNRDQFGSPRTCSDGSEGGSSEATRSICIRSTRRFPSTASRIKCPEWPRRSLWSPIRIPFLSGTAEAERFPPGKYLLMRVTLRLRPTTLSSGCGALIFVSVQLLFAPGRGHRVRVRLPRRVGRRVAPARRGLVPTRVISGVHGQHGARPNPRVSRRG